MITHKALSHTFAYNNLTALEQLFHTHRNEFAAVIMEPMTNQWSDDGFLKGVKDLGDSFLSETFVLHKSSKINKIIKNKIKK